MKTVLEIKQKISELNSRLEDLEMERDILQYKLDEADDDIADIENKIKKYETELKTQYILSTENLTSKDVALLLLDESDYRKKLYGQMLIDEHYCICNGFALICSKEKFDGIDEIPAVDALIEVYRYKPAVTEIVDYIRSQDDYIILGKERIWVNNKYILLASCILGEPKRISLTSKTTSIYFETEKGKAIILPTKNQDA